VSVQIEAMDGGKLRLTGDVDDVLALTASAVTDGFSFACQTAFKRDPRSASKRDPLFR